MVEPQYWEVRGKYLKSTNQYDRLFVSDITLITNLLMLLSLVIFGICELATHKCLIILYHHYEQFSEHNKFISLIATNGHKQS